MTEEVTASLRRLVTERARGQCEYCRLPQTFTLYAHEPDHILPAQHDGQTTAENLALACMRCNRHKGPNVGSYDPVTGQLTPFFNPRHHLWQEHFRFDGPIIQPLTPEARVTVKILRLNDHDRVEERQRLMALGVYPLEK